MRAKQYSGPDEADLSAYVRRPFFCSGTTDAAVVTAGERCPIPTSTEIADRLRSSTQRRARMLSQMRVVGSHVPATSVSITSAP